MLSFLNDPHYFTAVAVVLGLCVGSFLNVVIHRLPRMLERQWRLEGAEIAGPEAPGEVRYGLVLPPSR